MDYEVYSKCIIKEVSDGTYHGKQKKSQNNPEALWLNKSNRNKPNRSDKCGGSFQADDQESTSTGKCHLNFD